MIHRISIIKHPELVKEAEHYFDRKYNGFFDSSGDWKDKNLCLSLRENETTWSWGYDYWPDGILVYTLDEFFSISPKLYDKYMRRNTKLGELL